MNNTIKVYTLSLDELYKMTPQNGDDIEVFALSAQNANLVKISGNILIPGEKELPRDSQLSTLLNNELKDFGQNGFFKADTNYDYALIKNLDSVKSFNLRKVLDRATDVTLKSGDEIVILNKYDIKDKSVGTCGKYCVLIVPKVEYKKILFLKGEKYARKSTPDFWG